jgi:hypothetical protein
MLVDYANIKNDLVSDGWLSPNTYDNYFEPVDNIPSIYILTMVDQYDYQNGLIAYVGMSINLAQRLSGHSVRKEIENEGFWVPVWFKPTAKEDLRTTELSYIKKYNPPWNVIGKKRGI